MDAQTLEISCPSCGEGFAVPTPPPNEVPCLIDYDCEICCRPLQIQISEEDGEIWAESQAS